MVSIREQYLDTWISVFLLPDINQGYLLCNKYPRFVTGNKVYELQRSSKKGHYSGTFWPGLTNYVVHIFSS